MREIESLPKYISSKEETLTCLTCGKNWTRLSRRGRKPKVCSECESVRIDLYENRRLETEAERLVRMAAMREKKAERQRERAQRQAEEEAQRRLSIAERLPNIDRMWNYAFTVALRENTDEAWRRCESLMYGYVNTKKALMK